MLIYLVISLILLTVGIRLIKKSYSDFDIKDYSSSKLQDRTFFGDIDDGFTFDVKNPDKKMLKKDIAVLKKVLKFAKTMPESKKQILKKLISNIKKSKVLFHNGISYNKAIKIINLSTDDIFDIVNADTPRILDKMFSFDILKVNPDNEEIKNYFKKCGISDNELSDYYSQHMAQHYVCTGFIKDDQYEILYNDYIKNGDIKNQEDIKKLSEKLEEILDETQKETLKNVSLKHLAYYMLFWGENTIYRITKLRQIFSDDFVNSDRELIKNVLKGHYTIDKETKQLTENPDQNYEKKTFHSNINMKNNVKKVSYINAFENHEKVLNDIKNAEKRYLKIPKIIVNFDFFSDIKVNTPPLGNFSDWINLVIKDYRINDIYWVVPPSVLINVKNTEYFFSENLDKDFNFKGNYNINKPYKDLSKPLSQKFLIDIRNASILSASSKFSEEEYLSYLKTGNYRVIKIHMCTSDNLPKLRKDFILSVDASYFVNSGFDADSFLEHVPCNLNRDLNEFLMLWKKKLNKATLVFLGVSPEYVGFHKIGKIRAFYVYLIKQVRNFSKNIY